MLIEPPRPRRFREPQDLRSATLTGIPPPFASHKKPTAGARAEGLKYEKKVHTELLRRYPEHYLPSPWFRFFDAHGMRWCQPDGLLIDIEQGVFTVVEVKHHHTSEAWWKLQKLYLPVARQIFGPNWKFACLEIVRWYEPDECFPFAKLCEFPHLCPPPPYTGVHIMKPGRV